MGCIGRWRNWKVGRRYVGCIHIGGESEETRALPKCRFWIFVMNVRVVEAYGSMCDGFGEISGDASSLPLFYDLSVILRRLKASERARTEILERN